MAYLFGDPDDEQQKTNIFQQDQPTVAAPGANSGSSSSMAPMGSGSSGGSSSGGSSTVAAPMAVPAQNVASPSPSNVSSKMASLSARQKAPDLSGISSNLSSNEQKLQNEADSYVQGAQQSAQKQTFDQKQADSAIGGDLEAVTALKSRLAKTQADQVEGFKGLQDYKNQTSQLQAPESQAGLLRGGNSSYTGGQQAFDARLLGRNKDFQAEAKGLVDRENALLKASDSQRTDLTKRAQDLQQSYLDIGNQQARTYLQNSNRDLAGQLEMRELVEEARRNDLNSFNIGAQRGQDLTTQIQKDFSSADPASINSRAAGMLNPNLDLSGYLNIDRDVDWRELVSQNEADRYNRVLGLLGDAGTSWAAGQGAGPDYTFDNTGAKDALLGDAVARRTAQDAAEQKAAEEAAKNGGLQEQIAAYEAAKRGGDPVRKGLIDAGTAPIEAAQGTRDTLERFLPINMKGAVDTLVTPITPSNQLEKDAKDALGRVIPNKNRFKVKL